MSDSSNCQSVLTSAFIEAAIAIGGVVAQYPIPDEATWEIVRALDLIHQDACRWCRVQDAGNGEDGGDEGHPAILYFLEQLRCRSIAAEVDGSLSEDS